MKKFSFIFLVLLSGCLPFEKPLPLEAHFERIVGQEEIYEKLEDMIKADSAGRQSFSVGKRNIGEYWEHGNLWNTNQNYERKVKINSVLEEYSISEERYQEYMSLLDLLGAQRVSYGNSEDPWVSVLMQATGLSVSGCSTTLERIKSGKIPETEQSAGYSTEVMEIKDGWYLRKHCT